MANRDERMRIVIIDDDPSHADLLRSNVERMCRSLGAPSEVVCFEDPAEAVAGLAGETNCVIICDYQLRGSTAFDWLPHFVRGDHGPVLIATAFGSEKIAVEAFRSGAADYLDKHRAIEDPEYLTRAIKSCHRRHNVATTLNELTARLRHTNRELEFKNDQLERATEAAQAFVDDVAHDFRTPLAVIKEFASIMSDGLAGPTTDEQLDHLRYIDQATDQLATMIDDFLDSTKLRAGLLRLSRRAISPRTLLAMTEPTLSSIAEQKGVGLEIRASDGLSAIWVDAGKAVRIIHNLATNAIKFSPVGSAVRIQAEEASPWVRVRVTDTGPGISPAEIDKIFDRLEQGGPDDAARSKGVGLGLSIATQLARVNFGRLEVASEPGKGSAFSVLLPQADPQALLRAYIRQLAARDSDEPLAAIVCEPNDSASADELRESLESVCWTQDLTMGVRGSVLLAGPCDRPARWLERIRAAGKDGSTVGFNSRLIGTWETPDHMESALASFLRSEERRHVAA